ncbi:MAG TPA: hypothetical protein VJZ04_02755 [Lachnospiraceae bacterium]|nr:hypothetical protein [Lachnospiraceae bacterium]
MRNLETIKISEEFRKFHYYINNEEMIQELEMVIDCIFDYVNNNNCSIVVFLNTNNNEFKLKFNFNYENTQLFNKNECFSYCYCIRRNSRKGFVKEDKLLRDLLDFKTRIERTVESLLFKENEEMKYCLDRNNKVKDLDLRDDDVISLNDSNFF